MKPTLGRVVHWKGDGDDAGWLAAIVVIGLGDPRMMKVDQFLVRYLSPDGPGWDRVTALTVTDEGKTWRWPPREAT